MKNLKVEKKKGLYSSYYAPLYVRIAARIVCWWMAKKNISAYEVCGKLNYTTSDGNVNIDATWDNILHCILRSCGYSCSSNDIAGMYKSKTVNEEVSVLTGQLPMFQRNVARN